MERLASSSLSSLSFPGLRAAHLDRHVVGPGRGRHLSVYLHSGHPLGHVVVIVVGLGILVLICDHRRGNRQCGFCPSTESPRSSFWGALYRGFLSHEETCFVICRP